MNNVYLLVNMNGTILPVMRSSIQHIELITWRSLLTSYDMLNSMHNACIHSTYMCMFGHVLQSPREIIMHTYIDIMNRDSGT